MTYSQKESFKLFIVTLRGTGSRLSAHANNLRGMCQMTSCEGAEETGTPGMHTAPKKHTGFRKRRVLLLLGLNDPPSEQAAR